MESRCGAGAGSFSRSRAAIAIAVITKTAIAPPATSMKTTAMISTFHLDGAGTARMVDVSAKPPTERYARARAVVRMSMKLAGAPPRSRRMS